MAKVRYYKVIPDTAVIIREQGIGADMTGFTKAESFDVADEVTRDALKAPLYYGAKMSLEALDIAKSVSKEFLVENGYTLYDNMTKETRLNLSVEFGCMSAEEVKKMMG